MGSGPGQALRQRLGVRRAREAGTWPWNPDLLLRSALALAARLHRERQRASQARPATQDRARRLHRAGHPGYRLGQ